MIGVITAQSLPASQATVTHLRLSHGPHMLLGAAHKRAFSDAVRRTGVQRKSRSGSWQVLAAAEDPEIGELLAAADALMRKLGTVEAAAAAQSEDPSQENGSGSRVMKLVCDESSCVIVPIAADQKTHGPEGSFIGSSGQAASQAHRPRDYVLSEGEGWKLGYDRNPINTAAFTAFVGSDAWSVSMTKQEFTDFVQLLRGLQHSIATLQVCGEWGEARPDGQGGRGEPHGAASTESSLHLETERIWMEARAPQKQLFDLTRIFRNGVRKRGASQTAAFHLRFIINAPKLERQREFEGQFPPEAVMRLLEHLEAYPPQLDTLQEQPYSADQAVFVANAS